MDYETSLILSRVKIRKIASFIRKKLSIKTIRFPVMRVLELFVTEYDDILCYTVEEDTSFKNGVMAELSMINDYRYCIRIRESVYNDASVGGRASTGFVCHELCHFILVHILGIKPKKYFDLNGIAYARQIYGWSIPAYKSMEWQAKALCGELMIPYEECKNYDLKTIIEETNSSDKQALYFLSNVVKKDNKNE